VGMYIGSMLGAECMNIMSRSLLYHGILLYDVGYGCVRRGDRQVCCFPILSLIFTRSRIVSFYCASKFTDQQVLQSR
jgi:hypothetical protein